MCEKHGQLYASCTCLVPYKLHTMPSAEPANLEWIRIFTNKCTCQFPNLQLLLQLILVSVLYKDYICFTACGGQLGLLVCFLCFHIFVLTLYTNICSVCHYSVLLIVPAV